MDDRIVTETKDETTLKKANDELCGARHHKDLNSLATDFFFGYTLYPSQNNGWTLWKGIFLLRFFV
jgi:hypothetical protein